MDKTAEIPNMVEVYTSQGHMRANAARLKLEAAGIPAILSYESAGLVFGLTVDGIGEVRVLVPQERGGEALDILAEERPEPEEPRE